MEFAIARVRRWIYSWRMATSSPAPSPGGPLPGIPVIVNPGARSARAGLRLNDIRALSPQVEMRETGGIGDASRLAEELARAGAPLIVAAGGDGTVNEVVTGIVRAGALGRTVLGVLPTGTMNVFAAELGLPAARLDECWQAITGGLAREVDLWRLNDTYFVQLAGVGFDAAIIRETSWESKKRFGPLSYLMSGWKVLGRRATVMSVQAAGREAVSGTVVLIGNGRHYGGPFPLFPHALPGDGLLDVVVMPGQGWQHFYAVGRALLSGHYAAKRGVHYFQTDQLRVEAADAVPYEVDGELAGAASVLDFSKHGRLTVMGARPGPL